MGYLEIGKMVTKTVRTRLPKSQVFNNMACPFDSAAVSELESMIKALPESAKNTVKCGLLKAILGVVSVKGKLFKIGIEKKDTLIKCLSEKYDKRMLKEIVKAKDTEQLSEAIQKFRSQLETQMAKQFNDWLGLPTIPQNIINKGGKATRDYILKALKCDKKTFTKIASAKDDNEFFKLYGEYSKRIQEKKIQGGVPIEIEQVMYKHKLKRSDTLLDILKAAKTNPTNSKVIEIEKILTEKYGLKFVDLGDNESVAKQVLEAVELATKNGRKIPNNIFVTNLCGSAGEALLHSDLSSTVLLEHMKSSDYVKVVLESEKKGQGKQINNIYDKFISMYEATEQKHLSTTHPLHTVIHEFNHLGQSPLLGARFRKVPKKFESTYKQLSDYASEGIPGEIEVELLTKQQLNKLNAEEEHLLDFLVK